MKKLYSTDYVIYDRKNDAIFKFIDIDEYVIYGSLEEANLDLDKNEDEEVISCTSLPSHWQDILIKQINKK